MRRQMTKSEQSSIREREVETDRKLGKVKKERMPIQRKDGELEKRGKQ